MSRVKTRQRPKFSAAAPHQSEPSRRAILRYIVGYIPRTASGDILNLHYARDTHIESSSIITSLVIVRAPPYDAEIPRESTMLSL